MKLNTTREQLLEAVELAEKITAKKEGMPILTCIMLDAKDVISVRSTNLESGIDIRVHANIEEQGSIAVASNVLSQTLRLISSDKVQLRADDGNLIVESKGTRTLIKSIPHDDFPLHAIDVPDSEMYSISREYLLNAIKSVIYSASHSMIRPELGSVYMVIEEKKITCVATDSFRLAERVIPQAINGNPASELIDVLIPVKHAQEMVYILERLSADFVDVLVDDSQLTISGGYVRFISRVIDATFPNYKEIVPKSFTTEVVLLKNDVVEMLRKARIFSGKEQYVGLHIYPSRKIFTATAHSNEVGEMSDSIDAALKGDDIDINFNIGYLSDCFNSIDSDSVSFYFSGPGRPLVIKGISDPTFSYLVMPLNR